MFNDNLFERITTSGPLYAAIAVGHEVAHAWIGDLVDLAGDHWLVEACATYLSRNAVRDLMPGCNGWNLPDSVIPDAGHYVTDAKLIKTLEHTIGRENLYHGLGNFFRRFADQNPTESDLTACWSQIVGRDLAGWAAGRTTR